MTKETNAAAKALLAARRKKLDQQAEWIAKLIDVDDESVMIDGQYGISLTPDQLDKLIDHIRAMGYQDAIDLLRAAGEEASNKGNPTQWAVFVASADFLEGAK